MEKIVDRIPEDIIERIPLFKKEWLEPLKKMRNHPHAPWWNSFCGDRLTSSDTELIKSFEESLYNERALRSSPGEKILSWIAGLVNRSLWFYETLKGIDFHKEFFRIPLMTRQDLQINLNAIVPIDLPLEKIIVNPTSGTTGQPVKCPNHPGAVGCYDPMIRFALSRHGVQLEAGYKNIAAIQICAQQNTMTYNTVHSYLDGAGFAKINITDHRWPEKESPAIYLDEMEPEFLSGDPFAFFMAMKKGLPFKGKALLSTAINLQGELRTRLEKHFHAPIVNIYSLNETGPIGYSCPCESGKFHILPTDYFIEITDADGNPVKEGEAGAIVVTGGRNSYLPFLRYNTGDRGQLDFTPCSCGDPAPSLRLQESREMVVFQTPSGTFVNPVDISRILKDYPVLLHQFIQNPDYSCLLRVYNKFPFSPEEEKNLLEKISKLFNNSIKITLKADLNPGKGKILPFICRIQK